jgi:solute carrier family 39 (zinc transporter), member 1/2/3
MVDDHDDHDDDHKEEEGGIDVKTFQIILLCCMICCVGFGFIPKAWGKCREDQYVLSFLNCFSAGIFLAMALVHMMPEAAEVYTIWAAKEGIERPFPLPYVMFFVGYLLILAIDRVAAKAYHAGHDHQEKTAPLKASDLQASPTDCQVYPNTVRDESVKSATPIAALEIDQTSNPDASKLENEHNPEKKSVSKTAAIILVLALGAHAFFEGIAFGL